MLSLYTYRTGFAILKLNQVHLEEYPSLVEGTGLENREVVKAAQGFESLFLRHNNIAGQSSMVARRAHNPEVIGSNPIPATNGSVVQRLSHSPVTRGIAGTIPVGTAILVSQLSWQSTRLKILVSLVRFQLKPPQIDNKPLLRGFYF